MTTALIMSTADIYRAAVHVCSRVNKTYFKTNTLCGRPPDLCF